MRIWGITYFCVIYINDYYGKHMAPKHLKAFAFDVTDLKDLHKLAETLNVPKETVKSLQLITLN